MGRFQTPEQIVSAAIQVGVDTIGLNSLAGAHSTLFTKVLNFLNDKGVSDILVYTGGIIPRDDAENLKRKGIIDIFSPGARTNKIVRRIGDKLS